MATDRRDLVERGLALKKAGNAIMEAVGGRAIHPVNVRLGGFYRARARAELVWLHRTAATCAARSRSRPSLGGRLRASPTTLRRRTCSPCPARHYPSSAGTVVTSGAWRSPAAECDDHVIEEQVPHSTALHARLSGHPGTLPHRASGQVHAQRPRGCPLAAAGGRCCRGPGGDCRNPFRSIVVGPSKSCTRSKRPSGSSRLTSRPPQPA